MNFEYLQYQYPILSPRLTILHQNKNQHSDRQHLIERFGFEPVHFLESSETYPIQKCLKSCFSFGNVVIGFKHLPLPMLQLSANEVGVPVIDVREADFVFVSNHQLLAKVRRIFPEIPIFIQNRSHFSGKISKIDLWRRKSSSVKKG